MTALHTVLTIIQVLLAVALVAIVTLQSGKSSGLSSAIAGGDNSFMGKTSRRRSTRSLLALPSGLALRSWS